MNRTLFLALVLLASSADAVRVGVVVDFPNGAVFTTCVDVDRDANGYEVLQAAGLPISWTHSPEGGHGLCQIMDTGCLDSGCQCAGAYWNFYAKKGAGEWVYSEVGFDGGTTCNEHYCARNGDLVGFTFNKYDVKPRDITFAEACPPKPPAAEEKSEPDIIGRYLANPAKGAGAITAVVLILLLVAYFAHKPWEYI